MPRLTPRAAAQLYLAGRRRPEKCHAACPDCGQGKACQADEENIGHTHRCRRCGYTWR